MLDFFRSKKVDPISLDAEKSLELAKENSLGPSVTDLRSTSGSRTSSNLSDNKLQVDIEHFKTNDVNYVIKPILISLRILGLWPKHETKFLKKFRIRSAFIMLYLHFYALHSLVNLVINIFRDQGFYTFLDNTSLVIRTLATAISMDLFFFFYYEIMDSLKDINSFPPLFIKCNLRDLRRYSNYISIGSWLFIFLQFAFSTWTVVTLDTQVFMDHYFYGFYAENVNIGLMKFIMSVIWILYVFITLSTEIFLKAFYIIACLLLGRCARSFNEMVIDLGNQKLVTGQDINYINLLHTNLSCLIYKLDMNFTTQTFIWFSTIFLNICIKISAILIIRDASIISSNANDVLNYIVILILIALVAGDVAIQCQQVSPVADRLAANVQLNDLSVLYQIKLMTSKVTTIRNKLTGWHFFVIDRTFIMTVIGAILTYSVILVQLSNKPNQF